MTLKNQRQLARLEYSDFMYCMSMTVTLIINANPSQAIDGTYYIDTHRHIHTHTCCHVIPMLVASH